FVDAQLAYAEGRFVEARESIQALLRNFPDHEEALALSGGIEARLGALVQASAQLGKALSLQPLHQAARLTLAEVERRLGQHTKALATLKSLLEAKEPSATALAIAGNAELRLGRPAAAQRYFQRAAASEPGNIRHKTAAMMASVAMGDALQALNELENLAKNSDSTHADEALFAARLGRGELDAALATLDSIAKKRPESAEPYEMRGRVLLMRRDLAGARAAFEQALKIDPAFYVATSNLALIDMIEAQPDAAIKRLRGAIERDPKNSQAMVTLAEVLVRQGAQVNEVKALFTEAVAATPLEAEPRLKLIEYTLRRRQLKDALAAAQDAVAALPGDVRILEAVGNAQVQAGDVEQGINTFRRLATSLPTSPMPYMKLADAYQLSNAREQMVAAAKKAVDIAPESSEAQAKLVDVLMRSGQPKVALEHARRMRAVKPQSPTGYLLEAIYESRSGNDAGAIAALREGVERTKSADIAGKLYSLLLKTERTSEAEKFGSAWLRSHPRDAAFEYLVSVADISRGDLSSAEARLRRVVNVYRDNVVALNNLAWVLAKTGKPGGIEFAQRAVNLSPDVPELLDTLAMTLAADRQWGAAIKTQKRALELAPDNAGLRLGLARIALDSGDKVTAGTELQRLEKLGAAFPGQGEVRE
ncbi:MAG: XrtA/PEP-CTERM system TPR-repeat protein PrsT, partial [bacterium]